MPTAHVGAEIDKSALVIIDMQNDFVHSDGRLAHRARENPDAKIDMPFLMGTIAHVKRMPRSLLACDQKSHGRASYLPRGGKLGRADRR